MIKIALALLLLAATADAVPVTGPYDFVSEYIRELGSLERLRETYEREAVGSSNSKMASCIRSSEAFQLELGGDIAALKGFQLSPQLQDVSKGIQELYSDEAQTYKQFGDVCGTFLAGEKPGVDYGALAAALPKLTATIRYIDQSLFEVTTPLVFGSLIAMKNDAQGHASHLVITRAQMDALANQIRSEFGTKLAAANPSDRVNAAHVLYTYIAEKGFKGSDEP